VVHWTRPTARGKFFGKNLLTGGIKEARGFPKERKWGVIPWKKKSTKKKTPRSGTIRVSFKVSSHPHEKENFKRGGCENSVLPWGGRTPCINLKQTYIEKGSFRNC